MYIEYIFGVFLRSNPLLPFVAVTNTNIAARLLVCVGFSLPAQSKSSDRSVTLWAPAS